MEAPWRPEEHWVEMEYRKLNSGTVTRRRTLAALLAEAEPTLVTRDGETFHLDRAGLDRLAAAATPEQRSVPLPITVHFTADADSEAYLTDPVAVAVLRQAEGWGPAYPFRDGKAWIPLSLAVDLIRRYGGAVQALYL